MYNWYIFYETVPLCGFLCFSLNFDFRYLGYPVCISLDVAYLYKYPNVCTEEVKYNKVYVFFDTLPRFLEGMCWLCTGQ